MDTLTFISKLVEALAWPAALLLALVILKKPIGDLLSVVQKLKYKEFEVEFGQRVEEVAAEVVKELPPVAQAPSVGEPIDLRPIYKLAEVSPRSAVLEAWRSIELASLAAARKLIGPEFRNKTMIYQALRALENAPNIDRKVLGLLRDLRGLRNEAAHAPDFALSKQSAIEYANAAEAVVGYLNSLEGGNQ